MKEKPREEEQVDFRTFFSKGHRVYIESYINRLKMILKKYDAAVFVARKSMCFYLALSANGEVPSPRSTRCQIYSSRILSYNRLEGLRGRKVALIDDVAITGSSLIKAAGFLKESNIEKDVYVAVASSDVCLDKICCPTIGEFGLDKEGVLELAKEINEYIEASMISNNVDQPVYQFYFHEAVDRDSFLSKAGSIDVSNSLQEKYGIGNKTIHLSPQPIVELLHGELSDHEICCKLRILYRVHNKYAPLKILPFVLLPALSQSRALEIHNTLVDKGIVKRGLLEKCESHSLAKSALKLVEYALADWIARCYFNRSAAIGNASRYEEVEVMAFGTTVLEPENNKRKASCCNASASSMQIDHIPGIEFHHTYKDALDLAFFSSKQLNVGKETSRAKEARYISFEMMTELATRRFAGESNREKAVLASVALDLLIDQGILVPQIVSLDDGSILRAYRQGETAKLTASRLKYFCYMLYRYLEKSGAKKIDDGYRVDPRELQSLCTIFFRIGYGKGLFGTDDPDEGELYSIAFSSYRVFVARDTGSGELRDSQDDSVLDFLGRAGYLLKESCYILNKPEDTEIDQGVELVCSSTARVLCTLKRKFNEIASNDSAKDHLEKYNGYLIEDASDLFDILALGQKKKDWVLAIASSIYEINRGIREGLVRSSRYLDIKEKTLRKAGSLCDLLADSEYNPGTAFQTIINPLTDSDVERDLFTMTFCVNLNHGHDQFGEAVVRKLNELVCNTLQCIEDLRSSPSADEEQAIKERLIRQVKTTEDICNVITPSGSIADFRLYDELLVYYVKNPMHSECFSPYNPADISGRLKVDIQPEHRIRALVVNDCAKAVTEKLALALGGRNFHSHIFWLNLPKHAEAVVIGQKVYSWWCSETLEQLFELGYDRYLTSSPRILVIAVDDSAEKNAYAAHYDETHMKDCGTLGNWKYYVRGSIDIPEQPAQHAHDITPSRGTKTKGVLNRTQDTEANNIR